MASYRQRYPRQKSPHRRFLFVLGAIFFLAYVILGFMLIFYKSLPIPLSQDRRIIMGIILIVYGIIRGVRVVQQFKDDNN